MNPSKYFFLVFFLSSISFLQIEASVNNSVILNYDSNLNDLGYWYQQLVAESLGKKGKGINPMLSFGPKDHHSLLQLYLDGPKDKFFTFFNSSQNENELCGLMSSPSGEGAGGWKLHLRMVAAATAHTCIGRGSLQIHPLAPSLPYPAADAPPPESQWSVVGTRQGGVF